MRRSNTFLPVLISLFAVLSLHPAAAQETAAPSAERAAERFAAGDFAGAAELYETVTEVEPENGAAWFGLGRAQFESRRVDRAIAALEKTLELGFEPARTMIHLARCYATTGADDQALDWIRKAAGTGVSIHQALESTEEFERLRQKAEFQEILGQVRPCNSPAYHRLDFWIGSWRVMTGEPEQQVGTNSIQRILSGCAVIENWKGASGTEGKSLFYFHEVDKTWKQVWVTDSGGVKEKRLIAVSASGGLRFQGDIRQDDGTIVLDRTTLIPIEQNKVRQIIEQSADGGDTWQLGFDAFYVRD